MLSSQPKNWRRLCWEVEDSDECVEVLSFPLWGFPSTPQYIPDRSSSSLRKSDSHDGKKIHKCAVSREGIFLYRSISVLDREM